MSNKIKLSAGFRTESCVQAYLGIMSYVSTTRIGEPGVFEVLQATS